MNIPKTLFDDAPIPLVIDLSALFNYMLHWIKEGHQSLPMGVLMDLIALAEEKIKNPVSERDKKILIKDTVLMSLTFHKEMMDMNIKTEEVSEKFVEDWIQKKFLEKQQQQV